MISINGFFLIPKTPIHLTFRSYYEIELNRIIKMYYSVEIPLKLESEPWSQQSSFDIRNGKPNVTSLLTKLGESRKKIVHNISQFHLNFEIANQIHLNTLALIFTW